LFKATGNASQLKQNKFKLQATARFQSVVDFLRKQLRCGANEALFLFINCTFSAGARRDCRRSCSAASTTTASWSSTTATTPAWG
jgi:ubiquitin-like protein ATG12